MLDTDKAVIQPILSFSDFINSKTNIFAWKDEKNVGFCCDHLVAMPVDIHEPLQHFLMDQKRLIDITVVMEIADQTSWNHFMDFWKSIDAISKMNYDDRVYHIAKMKPKSYLIHVSPRPGFGTPLLMLTHGKDKSGLMIEILFPVYDQPFTGVYWYHPVDEGVLSVLHANFKELSKLQFESPVNP